MWWGSEDDGNYDGATGNYLNFILLALRTEQKIKAALDGLPFRRN